MQVNLSSAAGASVEIDTPGCIFEAELVV